MGSPVDQVPQKHFPALEQKQSRQGLILACLFWHVWSSDMSTFCEGPEPRVMQVQQFLLCRRKARSLLEE